MAVNNTKIQVLRALRNLQATVDAFRMQKRLDTHRAYVAGEVSAFCALNWLNINVKNGVVVTAPAAGGEGVEYPAPPREADQSPPKGENPQCVSGGMGVPQGMDVYRTGLPSLGIPVGPAVVSWSNDALRADGAQAAALAQQKAIVASQDGWPEMATLKIVGVCPNPKLMACVWEQQGEGGAIRQRRVSMYRGGRMWRAGDAVPAKIMVRGGSPIYAPV